MNKSSSENALVYFSVKCKQPWCSSYCSRVVNRTGDDLNDFSCLKTSKHVFVFVFVVRLWLVVTGFSAYNNLDVRTES